MNRIGVSVFALGCAALCCAGPSMPPSASASAEVRPSAGAPLVDTAEISGNFLWRQRLLTRYAGDEWQFQGVLEKSGNSLKVLLLTPYGSRALLLEQTGKTVRSEYFVSQRLPFPAEYILYDIHRVLFLGFGPGAPRDGRYSHTVEGELLTDTYRKGAIVARTVERPLRGSKPKATVDVRYVPGYTPGSRPSRIELSNSEHGYQLVVETLSNEGS